MLLNQARIRWNAAIFKPLFKTRDAPRADFDPEGA